MSSQKSNQDAILCMFSGGVDSAGALHELITNEKYKAYQLLIHHVHIINREQRARAEANAVQKILTYYRKELSAKFLFTQSTFNTTGFASMHSIRFPFDMDVCSFTAANIVASFPTIKMIVRGRTKTDLEAADKFYEKRTARTHEILKSTLMFENIALPEYEFPVIDYYKREIWEFLPEKVRNNTWWCRKPVYSDHLEPERCGKCSTCKQVAEFY